MTILLCNHCERLINPNWDSDVFCHCRPERLNPEDAKSVCDSPNSENKKSPRDMQK